MPCHSSADGASGSFITEIVREVNLHVTAQTQVG